MAKWLNKKWRTLRNDLPYITGPLAVYTAWLATFLSRFVLIVFCSQWITRILYFQRPFYFVWFAYQLHLFSFSVRPKQLTQFHLFNEYNIFFPIKQYKEQSKITILISNQIQLPNGSWIFINIKDEWWLVGSRVGSPNPKLNIDFMVLIS